MFVLVLRTTGSCSLEPKKAESSENLDFLGLQDSRFLLPGNLGFDCHLEGLTMQQQQQQKKKALGQTTGPEGLLCPSSGDKKELTLTQDGSVSLMIET